MKIFLSLFLFISITSAAFTQSFEGKIVYTMNLQSKIPGVTDEQLSAMMGKTQQYFIKGGEYFSTADGTFFQWQRYISKDNKYYLKYANSENAYWYDGAINRNPDTLISQSKAVLKVLDHMCDELIFKTKDGIHKYYFSSKVPLDSKLFKAHQYGNFYNFLQYANAIPLKEIVIGKEFDMELVATEVSPQILDPKLFIMPADVKSQPAP